MAVAFTLSTNVLFAFGAVVLFVIFVIILYMFFGAFLRRKLCECCKRGRADVESGIQDSISNLNDSKEPLISGPVQEAVGQHPDIYHQESFRENEDPVLTPTEISKPVDVTSKSPIRTGSEGRLVQTAPATSLNLSENDKGLESCLQVSDRSAKLPEMGIIDSEEPDHEKIMTKNVGSEISAENEQMQYLSSPDAKYPKRGDQSKSPKHFQEDLEHITKQTDESQLIREASQVDSKPKRPFVSSPKNTNDGFGLKDPYSLSAKRIRLYSAHGQSEDDTSSQLYSPNHHSSDIEETGECLVTGSKVLWPLKSEISCSADVSQEKALSTENPPTPTKFLMDTSSTTLDGTNNQDLLVQIVTPESRIPSDGNVGLANHPQDSEIPVNHSGTQASKYSDHEKGFHESSYSEMIFPNGERVQHPSSAGEKHPEQVTEVGVADNLEFPSHISELKELQIQKSSIDDQFESQDQSSVSNLLLSPNEGSERYDEESLQMYSPIRPNSDLQDASQYLGLVSDVLSPVKSEISSGDQSIGSLNQSGTISYKNSTLNTGHETKHLSSNILEDSNLSSFSQHGVGATQISTKETVDIETTPVQDTQTHFAHEQDLELPGRTRSSFYSVVRKDSVDSLNTEEKIDASNLRKASGQRTFISSVESSSSCDTMMSATSY